MKNADMPAMPSKAEVSNTDEAFAYQCDHGSKFQFPGLTKREEALARFMAAMLSNPSMSYDPKGLADDADLYVDAYFEKLEAMR